MTDPPRMISVLSSGSACLGFLRSAGPKGFTAARAAVLVPTEAFCLWICAWRQQWVAAAEALGSSQEFRGWRQGFPGWRSVAYRSGAPSGLDWRRVGPRFARARRDSLLSDAPAPRRWRERQALSGRRPRARSAQRLPPASSARRAEQQCFRDRQVASSQTAGPNSRSSAWSPATSQVPEPLPRLSAWVFRRKTATPKRLQPLYKSRPDSAAKPPREPRLFISFSITRRRS